MLPEEWGGLPGGGGPHAGLEGRVGLEGGEGGRGHVRKWGRGHRPAKAWHVGELQAFGSVSLGEEGGE